MTDTPRDDTPLNDTPLNDTDARLDAEETEFSNEHPLASPNELSGDAMSGVELEFLARDIAEAEAGALPLGTDATGAAAGMALDDEGEQPEEDTLPLEGY